MRNQIRLSLATAFTFIAHAHICLPQTSAFSMAKADAGKVKVSIKEAPPKASTEAPRDGSKESEGSVESDSAKVNLDLRVTPDYCVRSLNKVDELITKNLFNPSIAKNDWAKIKTDHTKKILACKTIMELDAEINSAIAKLHLSHCQYVTTNDETYYYLNSLFGEFDKKLFPKKMDYTGVICGGKGLPSNQVRYVVDGSPGDKAKIQIGDKILSVSGEPYVGQANFFATAKRQVPLVLDRAGQRVEISISPIFANPYKQYVEACAKSVIDGTTPEGKRYGYVHLWAGGEDATRNFEHVLSNQQAKTDGLILDLRDGYGGNSLPDLDYFYRNPNGYPLFVMTDRNGKSYGETAFYDKPVVALINGGSRSGKELLAYSLKKSGRAKLVGEKTAGYVLGGRLFPIDDRSAIYIAVTDCKIEGTRLEGVGVEPDIVVPNLDHTADGAHAQLNKAKEILFAELNAASVSEKNKPEPESKSTGDRPSAESETTSGQRKSANSDEQSRN